MNKDGEKPHWPGDTMGTRGDVCWRAKGWILSRWHTVLLVSTALFQALWRPTKLASTLPPGGELPQCWLGEEIQVFALCPSRKQESLSLRLWEDFTFDSSWREIEKKTQPFLSQAGGCLHTQTGTVGYSTMVWVCPTSQPCQESLDPGGKEHIPGCEGLRGGQSTRCGWDRLLATPFGTAHDKVTLWPARRGCCLQSTFSV